MHISLPDLPLPISVDLVKSEGAPFPTQQINGLEVVKASKGTTFQIRLENPNTIAQTGKPLPRIYLVAIADGLNIGSLQPVDWTVPAYMQKGFVWKSDSDFFPQVDFLLGWMLGPKELQKFRFVSPEEGFLAQRNPDLFALHQHDWCGTIEIACYVEAASSFERPTKSFPSGAIGGGEIVDNPYQL
ncbi:MAG: hypothetical protein AAF135_23620, partial [Bacteroidota bacterium]